MVGRFVVSLSVVALLFGASAAHAAPKAKPKPVAAKSKVAPAPKPKKGKETEKDKDKEKDKPDDADHEKDKPDDKSTAADDARAAAKEEGVKSAGTATPKSSEPSSVKVKEDKEGVKTYKFETVEVEGRLKSPQVIYFLRRVRAEFEAGALGHRSFLGELSDSRRSAAFR
jgi:hypothetical protein